MRRRFERWRTWFAILLFSALSTGVSRAAEPRPLASRGGVPTLSRVIALARAVAPDVVIGEAQVNTARSTMVGARLPPIGNPYVEVLGRAPPSGPYGQYSVDSTLWLPLEVAGQRSTRIAESEALITFQQKSLAYRQVLAVAEAVRTYGKVSVDAERWRVLEVLLEVARKEAVSYEERYKAGDATLRDARLAELELGRYGFMLEEARADVTAGLSELGRLTGETYTMPPGALDAPPALDVVLAAERSPVLAVSKAEATYYARAKDRAEREGVAGALSIMLNAGRDELGGPRIGAGVAYAFPIPRRNQGEQARADAERQRALTELEVNRRVLVARVKGLAEELERVRRALDILSSQAEPAAVAAVEAAQEMQRAGKSDLYPVLTSRRDLGLLRLRRLDLVLREWTILGELTAITGMTT